MLCVCEYYFAQVQRWAIETVKSLDPIDSMTFEEIEVTIKWIMSIIKYDLLENPQPENEGKHTHRTDM